MLLIADSGSTKTTWVLLQNKKVLKQFKSDGFNPYMQTHEQIFVSITQQVIPHFEQAELNAISQLFFYGAGCSDKEKNLLIEQNLKHFFKSALITIEHDLMGAAIAVCGNNNGLAAILGTGSNSCLFENGKITQNIPSLGLYLGDEGSGGYMGKLFIRNFFYQKFSKEVNQLIEKELGLTKEMVLDKVYKQPMPNRYLASFTHFINQHLDNPELKQIVHTSFNDFVNLNLKSYPKYPSYSLGVVGSVGYVFKDILNEVCAQNQINLKTVIKDPIEGLINYHAQNS